MRVSTNTVFDLGVAALTRQQSELLKTQQQIATGRRIVTPSDDPVASAKVLDVTQIDSINQQHKVNRDAAKDNLGLTDTILKSITDLIQNVREVAISGGDAAYTNSDRLSLVTELQARFNELLDFANSTDGKGQYLFSGYQATVKPFTQTAIGAQYLGDQGNRLIQISDSRQLAISAAGSEIFEKIKTGNGTFVTQANAANTGTGVISPGSIVNSAALTGHNYQIVFTVGATTTYDIVDTTTATTISAANAYTSGNSITFDGIQIEIEGIPANADLFTVTPSTNQSLFKTIRDLINTLSISVSNPTTGAKLTNGLNTAVLNLDQALDTLLGQRAIVGTGLQEVDALQSLGEDLSLQYSQTLSRLRDVDYAQAISQLTREQTYLEAAQQSFKNIAGLSLFDYL